MVELRIFIELVRFYVKLKTFKAYIDTIGAGYCSSFTMSFQSLLVQVIALFLRSNHKEKAGSTGNSGDFVTEDLYGLPMLYLYFYFDFQFEIVRYKCSFNCSFSWSLTSSVFVTVKK